LIGIQDIAWGGEFGETGFTGLMHCFYRGRETAARFATDISFLVGLKEVDKGVQTDNGIWWTAAYGVDEGRWGWFIGLV
jgi:hypothetical protein